MDEARGATSVEMRRMRGGEMVRDAMSEGEKVG